MASFLRRLLFTKKKRPTRKDSVTGRNHPFEVPYLSRLEGNQLQNGQSLIVRGIVTGDEGFIVNLTNGTRVELEDGDQAEGQLDDRLLAIRVDMRKSRVYFNACIQDQWGKEAFIKQKYRAGDEFDMRIRCFEQHFQIFVEHKLVANFRHYVPMNNISHVYVNGSIQLFTVSWEGKLYTLPYSAEIPGNFFAGRKLFLSGVIESKIKSFTIDFFAGDDVALRIEPSFAKKKTIRKSRLNGTWSKDETVEDFKFPFRIKRSFDVLVFADEERFLVFVNDSLYASFVHRLPSANIGRIEIDGKVELFGVHLK